jgi:hypothetical protein
MWFDLTLSQALVKGQMLRYSPINGDFQTYNPLRRMAAGQVPGRDFQPYMGFGTTYVTYLPFKLMGETFAASKFSAELSHEWLFGLASFVLFILLRFNWKTSLALSFLVQIYAIIPTLDPTSSPSVFATLSTAENSALGLRATLPFLSAGLLLLIYNRKADFTKNQEALLWGVMAGAQGCWSNDFGYASLAALSATYLLFVWRASPKVSSLLVHFLGVIAGYILLFFIVTQGYPLRTLSYNFGGVAKDQFWYFMLNENEKIFSLGGLLKYVVEFPIVSLPTLSALAISIYVMAQKKADLKDILFFYIVTATLAAAAIATIGGGIQARYFCAPMRLVYFIALFFILKCIPNIFQEKYQKFLIPASAICGVLFYILYAPVSLLNWKKEVLILAGKDHFYSEAAGGFLENSQKREIKIAKQFENKTVFSTYSSLMEALSNKFQPSGIDYIIHALGKENRAHYLQSFKDSQPDFVTTPNERPSSDEYWTPWETWSRRANWWFYREMLLSFEPVAQMPLHVVWQRRKKPINVQKYASNVNCSIKNDMLLITDKLPKGTYYIELTVKNHITFQKSGVPVIGNRALLLVNEVSSGLIAVKGKITGPRNVYSRDYTQNPQLLMIEHIAGKPSELYLGVKPSERTTLEIESCKVSRVYDYPKLPPAAARSAAY